MKTQRDLVLLPFILVGDVLSATYGDKLKISLVSKYLDTRLW